MALRLRTPPPEHAFPSPVPATERRVERVPPLDGFRALAVLWVFLLHIWILGGHSGLDHGLVRAVISQGYLGVDLLFILSGFVLFLPVALNQGNLGSIRSYALRRAARIIPAYYVGLVLVLALHRLISPAPLPMPWDGWHGLWSFLSHLLFLQTFQISPSVTIGYVYLAATWTLTIEATFYVLLPLVARAFQRRPVLWLALALAGAEIWQLAIAPAGGIPPTGTQAVELNRLVMSFPTYLGHFALGMASAVFFVRMKLPAMARAGRIAAVGVAVASATCLLAFFVHRSSEIPEGSNYLVQRMDTAFLALLFTAFMLAIALGPPWAKWPFANRLMVGLGDASYGIYLGHATLVLLALWRFGVPADGTVEAFLQLVFFTVPPAMALGWLSCRFIEQPARSWARRRIVTHERVPDYPPLDLVPAVAPEPLA